MPRRKYNLNQKAKLADLQQAWKSWRENRDSLKQRIEQQIEEELAAEKRVVSRKANEAVRAGVTKTDVKLAVHTSNWDSLMGWLKLTEDEFALEGAIEETSFYEWLPEDNQETKGVLQRALQDIRTGEKWRVWGIGPEDDYWYVVSTFTNDHYSTKLETFKPGDEFPDHVLWFIEQEEE